MSSPLLRPLSIFAAGFTFGYTSSSSPSYCESTKTTPSTSRLLTSSPTLLSFSKVKLFTGNAHPDLAHEIASHLGLSVSSASVAPFADGETGIKVHDNVRGMDVYVIQPTCGPKINDSIMELLLMITTLRRASANRITAILPYYGYGRSTETFAAKRPIAGADMAILLEVAGADRIVAVDLHRGQTQGFFSPSIPVDNLNASKLALPHFSTKFLHNPVIVSPDASGTPRAKTFCDQLCKVGQNATVGMVVDSECNTDDEDKFDGKNVSHVKKVQLIGDVYGKDVIIVDDIIDSGKRMCRTADLVHASGADRVKKQVRKEKG